MKEFSQNIDIKSDDIRKSKFNEAALKMARINKLQDCINLCAMFKKSHFFGYVELGLPPSDKRNYSVIFELINQLLQEVFPKLNKKEQEESISKRAVIREFMTVHPAYIYVHKASLNKKVEIFRPAEWAVTEKLLEEYESYVRSLIDRHGFTGQEAMDPSTAALD